MSKSKSYNRIVFLTTLSVYLGLVLVGGTAPVLAQRTTKVQTEAKFQKRNAPCVNFSSEAENLFLKGFFVEPINEFLKSLESVSEDYDYSSNAKSNQLFRIDYAVQDVDGSIVGIFTDDRNFPIKNRHLYTILNNTVIDLINQLPRKNFRVTNFKSSIEKGATLQRTKFELTKTEFVAQISFDAVSVEKARQFANLFNETFSIGSCRSKVGKPLYENTKAISENNKVLIVTHLPRGSIDFTA